MQTPRPGDAPVGAGAGVNAPRTSIGTVRRAAAFAAVWAVLWWLLAGADPASWLVGLPAVLAATLFCLARPARGTRIDPLGALRFATVFVRDSLRGGVDVSARVMRPVMRVAPGSIDYRTRLGTDGAPFVCFVQLVGLLPGTLVADIDGDRLTVHVLDIGQPVADDLRRLEDAVAAMFGFPRQGEMR